jgi:carboxymethylenebutenolidase
MRTAALTALMLVAGCAAARTPPAAAEPCCLPTAPQKVTFGRGADPAGGLLFVPPPKGRRPALLVIHEDYGLTDWVTKEAAALAGRGYVVLAIDLYRGTVVEGVEDAHIMERALPLNQVMADLKAGVDLLAGRTDVDPLAIGVLGWDIGGGFALDAAIADERITAAVVCYGRLVTDPAALRSLRAAVLGVFAGNDAGIDRATIDRFTAAMQKAGRPAPSIHVFEGAEHYFLRTDGGSPAARRARAEIERFLSARRASG